ncbi:helix-turn-helix transcriptional regulator [Chitinimonas sp. BJB300]|uniref:helix-turn-helix transcriptional regulator n=1 Tax=Chitinimonas sp. BJB300 TaxID=1559339 RepID=UPI000C0D93E4|nr:AlpA family transcriptional regulator [Chitinimonas sp. BJB300]PHV09935.1 AlpA family transcriptional regulator [Chitinimonas sp. BJB300]TSJ83243.1 AlpA family transcriptional regulator [Chitinimonas sp. BJB300]
MTQLTPSYDETASDTAGTSSLRHDRFMRLPEVLAKCGFSRTGLYDAMRLRGFPTSIHLGPRNVAWLESEVLAWMQQCIAQRQA